MSSAIRVATRGGQGNHARRYVIQCVGVIRARRLMGQRYWPAWTNGEFPARKLLARLRSQPNDRTVVATPDGHAFAQIMKYLEFRGGLFAAEISGSWPTRLSIGSARISGKHHAGGGGVGDELSRVFCDDLPLCCDESSACVYDGALGQDGTCVGSHRAYIPDLKIG